MYYFSNLFDKVFYMFRTGPLSETCRVLYQISMRNSASHLAFIIRIYHDAWSSECQKNILTSTYSYIVHYV